ncbi:alpha-amylase [Streptomyces sp. GC420]|uniref:alpha-amylase n=1 Tax=Streptomyces sp. GC420 TaxID=2697568 RepID=UPI001415180A|nr:alpha-amylase [Streptomyces sp. GC420]NBM19989.1 alpha-amylase [Streptomyces sp. GC420]
MFRQLSKRVTAAVALVLTAFGTGGTALAAGGAEAPACVTYSTGWRYTFVTNGCEGTQQVEVVYTDGTLGPCRAIDPRQTATFAGYGTTANHPVRVDSCRVDEPVNG